MVLALDQQLDQQTDGRYAERLSVALRSRTAKVAVIGLGYVGLPMAIAFARVGFCVVGIDVDQDRCASLAGGHSYVEDLSDAELQTALENGTLQVSNEFTALSKSDVILICVPTPLR